MNKKNIIIAKVTVIELVLIWQLYVYGTESVESSIYLLMVGIGAGFLLFICIPAITYVITGETAIILKGKNFTGWRYWWRLFLLSILVGLVFVLTFNATVDLSPHKTEKWKVVYNGRITLKYFDLINSRIYHGTNEKMLVLTRNGKRLIYTYAPDSLSTYLSNMTKGTLARVQLQMGGIGFFHVDYIWKN